jgi:hypothetical protein
MPESTPSYNSVCATCHAAIGALIIITSAYIHNLYPGWGWWLGIFILSFYTVLKEYVIDLILEHDGLGWTDPDGVSASLQDFTWYWVGGIVAGIFLWLVH